MRQRFEQQFSLGITPIADVKIRTKSRDEMPPALVALQAIFVNRVLNEKVFLILEETVLKNKKATGRKGMDLWHILVLSVVRHVCNTNFDKLQRYANTDMELRSIMGLHNKDFQDDFVFFEKQNIVDNMKLLDAETINKINVLVVETFSDNTGNGIKLLKKKAKPVLN